MGQVYGMLAGDTNVSYLWRLYRVCDLWVCDWECRGADMWFVKEMIYVCYLQIYQVNKGETSQGLPSLQLRPDWVIHWSFLLPPWSLLSYLICTSLSVHRPHVQQPSQRTWWYSQATAVGRKDIKAFNFTVFSADIPFRVVTGPSKKGL